MYNIKITPGAERDIGKLRQRISRQDFERLRSAITSLADEPRPPGVKKIKGGKRVYRIRVGSYRIVYQLYDDEQQVVIVEIARRTESTYRS